MSNSKLKPCPFCGGEAVVHTFGTEYMVECLECAVCTVCEKTKAEAIAAWNKRTNPDAANFSYSKKSNNSELGNYPEKQDSLNELVEFVRFCADASTGCIVYINNRARDIIAKSKEKRVCVKQNSETLDTNSVVSSRVNVSSICKENLQVGSRLTYADIERMVKTLEWSYRRLEDRGDCEYAFISKNRAFKVVGCLGDCRLIFWDKFGSVIDTLAIVEDGERDLDVQKTNARKFLVDLVAAALGVERSGE